MASSAKEQKVQDSKRNREFQSCDGFVSMSTMPQRSHLTDSEAWRVVGRLEGGQTQAEVAQAIGVSQSRISRICVWKRFFGDWKCRPKTRTRS
ncbi:hypothetical protein TNCV_5133091 [Trichonephila clavipes]|nr:hypothetical protein TNCV_5133091 [Trichonephila clavipes]